VKTFLLGFLIGAVGGAAGLWWGLEHLQSRPFANARDAALGRTVRVTHNIQDALASLSPETVREEILKTGMVVRDKARQAGSAVADYANDARITASLKGRLLSHSAASALQINIETTDGLVTLSGTVPTHEAVTQAVRTALEIDGVRKVVSTLQVKPGG
jgi:hypothetical protein